MSIWQTRERWEMLLASGQVESIFDIEWIQIEKRKIWLGEYWFFILWVSSIVSFYVRWDETLKKIISLAKKEKVLFIQIETLNYFHSSLDQVESEYILEWYYKKFITPYTAVINLEQSEDDILKNMKPKGRYNIRLAEKKWVVVKEVKKTEKNVKHFYELMKETTSRDSFSWNTLNYYITFLKKIESSKLLLAYVDYEVIAGWIFVFEKTASIYYYWASSSNERFRNLMSPYLLQWEAIKIAKTAWSKLYDFLWVSTPWEKCSLAWVTDFKKKVTKDIREVSTSYIWVNKKIKYSLILFLRFVKKIFR